MPIYAKNSGGGNYKQASAGGHVAVCCDVIDLGMQEDDFTPGKLRHQIRVVWQIDEDRTDGKPFEVSKWFTLSLHEKANLRSALESWRGKAFDPAEIESGFDVEKLLSKPAYVTLIYKPDKKYPDISAIIPLPRGVPPIHVRDYVRVCDRKPTEPEAAAYAPDDMALDEVPF